MIKLLFLGCNTDQAPYLKIAKSKGYFVVGTDLNLNAPGVSLCDKFYNVGYEDYAGLAELGKKEEFGPTDKIFTAGSQFAYLGASFFAEEFKISFISRKTALLCLDKSSFYPFFENYGLNVPEWKIWNGVLPSYPAYLKSDFGKSPNYCYRINSEEKLLDLPQTHDRFYRKCFILQKEVLGTHYRINFVGGKFFAFKKKTDVESMPARDFAFDSKTRDNIERMLNDLGLSKHLVKFDIIVADSDATVRASGKIYFLDIGLEPPMRLKIYLDRLRYDFDNLYFEHLVENKINYPDFSILPDLVIKK
ncbi:MAG TPA: hypothetical protein VJH05_01115 [Candidatus Paceibacterota bacterium]